MIILFCITAWSRAAALFPSGFVHIPPCKAGLSAGGLRRSAKLFKCVLRKTVKLQKFPTHNEREWAHTGRRSFRVRKCMFAFQASVGPSRPIFLSAVI